MRNSILVNLLSFVFSLQALAHSGVIGNGGDVVYCESGVPFKIKVLEEYEAEDFGWVIPPTVSANYVDATREILQRSAYGRYPALSRRIEDLAESFLTEAKFLVGKELNDITDSYHVAIPAGCKIRQLVILNPKSHYEENRFVVNKDLWDLLNPQQQAIVMIHEGLYEVAIQMNVKDSIGIRHLNSLIFTDRLDSEFKTDKEFYDYLKEINFDYFEKSGMAFNIFWVRNEQRPVKPVVRFYESGRMRLISSRAPGFIFQEPTTIQVGSYEYRIESGDWSRMRALFDDTPENQFIGITNPWSRSGQLCRRKDDVCLDFEKLEVENNADFRDINYSVITLVYKGNGYNFRAKYNLKYTEILYVESIIDLIFKVYVDKTHQLSCDLLSSYKLPESGVKMSLLNSEDLDESFEKLHCK